jgi:serine protease Do
MAISAQDLVRQSGWSLDSKLKRRVTSKNNALQQAVALSRTFSPVEQTSTPSRTRVVCKRPRHPATLTRVDGGVGLGRQPAADRSFDMRHPCTVTCRNLRARPDIFVRDRELGWLAVRALRRTIRTAWYVENPVSLWRQLPLMARWIALILVLGGHAAADETSSGDWFNKFDAEGRFLIQTELTLTGSYYSLIDGEFGPATYKALRTFQAKVGGMPRDGVLSQAQHSELHNLAGEKAAELGLTELTDDRSGLTLLLPRALLGQSTEGDRYVSYTSADGAMVLRLWWQDNAKSPFEGVFGQLVVAGKQRQISYSRLSDDFFVVSGKQGRDYFYTRMNRLADRTTGFTLTYAERYRDVGAIVSVILSSYARPEQALSGAPEGADQRKADSLPLISSGTGLSFSTDGLILTNNHVVESCSQIDVLGFGPARIVKRDPEVDLAAIQLVSKSDLPFATFRTQRARLGEEVVLVGYPLTDILGGELNVSSGVVSSKVGLGGDPNWFTTNVGIQPGNSGGPILDFEGLVLGIAVAKIDDLKLLQDAGTVAPNVGFGIQSDIILKFIRVFEHDEASGSARKSVEQIAGVARDYTVQIICNQSAATNVAGAAAP